MKSGTGSTISSLTSSSKQHLLTKILLASLLVISSSAHFNYTWQPIGPYQSMTPYFNTNITVDADIFYTSTYEAGPDQNGYPA